MKFQDLTGQKFGRLTVIAKVPGVRKDTMWLAKCDCGNAKNVRGTDMKSGKTQSCGCLRNESVSAARSTHRMCGTGTYNSWRGMCERCANPAHNQYKNYGGRGISVDQRWLVFENFFADMGHRPAGMSIDRIDSEGNYSADNCRWATQADQQRNRRNLRFTVETVQQLRSGSGELPDSVSRSAVWRAKTGRTWAGVDA